MKAPAKIANDSKRDDKTSCSKIRLMVNIAGEDQVEGGWKMLKE